MKKLVLTIASIAMAASPALASKARQSALSDSRNINDFQQAFARPYLFNNFGTMATFEWGNSGDALTSTHAEGGFLKSSDDATYGIYFGRRSVTFTASALELGGTLANPDALLEQNPFNLIYAAKTGDISWGATLKYSSGKDDASDLKSSSAGFAVGATNGTWEAELTLGLLGKADEGADSVEAKGNVEIGLGYKLNEKSMAYLKTASSKADATVSNVTSTAFEATTSEIGYINDLVSSDSAKVFYGVAYRMSDYKTVPAAAAAIQAEGKSSSLPVWFGVEAAATEWMTFRASVSQSVLINETDNGTAKSNKDNIAFAAGAGFKLGKGMVDAMFGTDNSGHLSFSEGSGTNDKFLSQVSYTYMF